MADFKSSKTAGNLMKAFAGESQARMRYTFFAKIAQEEGFPQIGDIFLETAENEKVHANLFYKHLVKNMNFNMNHVDADYPVALGKTEQNLEWAANGENEEWSMLYPQFAKIAEEEGYKTVATAFKIISKIEKAHEERYRKLYDNLESGKVFERDGKVVWKCRVCGYLHEGKKPPLNCPACAHPQAYFELQTENY